jgi:predicted nucleic acid-binding protein
MTFADTSALIALFNPVDNFHSKAKEWFIASRPKLILTDYIIDELLVLILGLIWLEVSFLSMISVHRRSHLATLGQRSQINGGPNNSFVI